LRRYVPDSLLALCSPGAAVAPVLAVQECVAESGAIRVRYALFESIDAMNEAYSRVRRELDVPADSGRAGERCQDAAAFPDEGSYTASGEPAGRLLCVLVGSEARFEWSDRRVAVLTSATDTSGDERRLYRLWRDGRLPRPPARTPGPPASPDPTQPRTASEPPAATDAPAATEPPAATDAPTEPPVEGAFEATPAASGP
jgi:hypothetical protein